MWLAAFVIHGFFKSNSVTLLLEVKRRVQSSYYTAMIRKQETLTKVWQKEREFFWR